MKQSGIPPMPQQLMQQSVGANNRGSGVIEPENEFDDCNRKVQEIKKMLIKFKFSHRVREGTTDYHDFARFLALNDQL